MPGCFIDQRERSRKELKSKGGIGRVRQRGSKWRGSSVSKGMACLWRGVLISAIQISRAPFRAEQRHFPLQLASGQGPPGKPLSIIIITKATKSKSKKQFPMWSQNWLPSSNRIKIAREISITSDR